MSVLSITAPQFTAENERLEQETYTEEELEAAERDLFGRPSIDDPPMSEDDLDNLLKDFNQALGETPPEEREAYMEALERVPQLVELESHPLTFLKAEGYYGWGAAERCVNYWELRRWLFGDRAFLPISSTGHGALVEDDIHLLKSGFCCLLEDDEQGRGVVCFQVPSRTLDCDRMAMVRIIFYVLTVALERPQVQENGLVLVADTNNYTTSRFDRKFIKCVAYLFTGYHPIVTRAYHICAPPGKSCFMLVLPFIRYFTTRHVRQRFLVHTGTAPECAMDLQDYGITTKHLPQNMGGNHQLNDFLEWLIQRQQLEGEREETLFSIDDCEIDHTIG